MAAGPVRELFGRGGQLDTELEPVMEHSATNTEDITFIQGKETDLTQNCLKGDTSGSSQPYAIKKSCVSV